MFDFVCLASLVSVKKCVGHVKTGGRLPPFSVCKMILQACVLGVSCTRIYKRTIQMYTTTSCQKVLQASCKGISAKTSCKHVVQERTAKRSCYNELQILQGA